MSVVEVSSQSKKGTSFTTVADTSVNTDFISFTESSFQATVGGMQTLFNKAVNQYQIPAERIFTAISSGVKGQAEKENKMNWVQNLADSFRSRIFDPNRTVQVIDVLEEARLSHLGIVPDQRRFSTFLIDIGSGNTKGGYFPNG